MMQAQLEEVVDWLLQMEKGEVELWLIQNT